MSNLMAEEGRLGRTHGVRPLISLIVMAYNQEWCVRGAIEAAFAQTWTPLEILLSDDCSIDGTFQIMKEMAAIYDGPHRIILNRNPVNIGLIEHLNRCIDLTSGELIVYNAGDDISEPDRATQLVKPWLAYRGKVHLVHSAVQRITDDGTLEFVWHADARMIETPAPDPFTALRWSCNHIGASAAFTRTLWERFGPLPRSATIEDGPIFFRAVLAGGTAYVAEPLLRYRTSGISARRAQSAGYHRLYGPSRHAHLWRLTNDRTARADIAPLDFPGKAACVRLLDSRISRFEDRIRYAEMTPAARLADLPRAISKSRARRSITPLKDWGLYSFAPLTITAANLVSPGWRSTLRKLLLRAVGRGIY